MEVKIKDDFEDEKKNLVLSLRSLQLSDCERTHWMEAVAHSSAFIGKLSPKGLPKK